MNVTIGAVLADGDIWPVPEGPPPPSANTLLASAPRGVGNVRRVPRRVRRGLRHDGWKHQRGAEAASMKGLDVALLGTVLLGGVGAVVGVVV